jgi:hypothetical protein
MMYFILMLNLCLAIPCQDLKIKEKNPALIYGSDFGSIFQVYLLQQDFDNLLKRTANINLKTFGPEKLKELYSKVDFRYTIKLRSMKQKNTLWILSYDAEINCTRKVIRIQLVNEDGIFKILLPEAFETTLNPTI